MRAFLLVALAVALGLALAMPIAAHAVTARTSGPHDDKGAIAAGLFAEWNVTPLVTADGAVSFVLATTSYDGASREDSTSSRRPQLSVTSGG